MVCILSFALNRVCILGIFCPKQVQGFKPLAVHLYPNIGWILPPPTTQEFHRVLFLPLLALYVPSVILRKGAQIVSAKIEMHKYPAATWKQSSVIIIVKMS